METPVPKALAGAAGAIFAQGEKPVPYHGCYSHILTGQGFRRQAGRGLRWTTASPKLPTALELGQCTLTLTPRELLDPPFAVQS